MRRFTWLSASVVAGVLGSLCVLANPAMADEERAKVSVRVDNGVDELDAEGPVEYTIRVRNESGTGLQSAVVSQLLPAALEFRSAEPKPDEAEVNQVQWIVPIPAGQTVTLRMTGQVAGVGAVREVEGKLRLTSSVCVAPDDESPLDACASESDLVGPPAPPDDDTERVVVPAALGVVVAGGGGYLWYRRKSNRPADE